MRALALLFVLTVAQAANYAQPDGFGWRREGNRIGFTVQPGRAYVEWVSAATLRFVREWDAPPIGAEPGEGEPVEFEATDAGPTLILKSRYLTVNIGKSDLRLRIHDAGGQLLLDQPAGLRRERNEITLEHTAQSGEMYFGLGVSHPEVALNLRGRSISTGRPFLISSVGYGLFVARSERTAFDLARTDPGKVRISLNGGRVELVLHYGPTPKEILEQHLPVERPRGGWHRDDLGLLPAALPAYATRIAAEGAPSLRALQVAVVRLLQAAFSAQPVPVFDVSRFDAAPPEVRSVARQLAALAPLAAGRPRDEDWILERRRRLRPFLEAYFQEAFDRGFPIVRPMAMQYPKDPEAVNCIDQFLLGDELLAAPPLSPVPLRRVYLPMGIWTDLRTNRVYTGRRYLEVETAGETPVFAKNGALIPFLRADDLIEAHYFPRLGGEFFIYEPDAGDYTQLHASPAGDLYRLEIETKVTRDYEWVVHHMLPVRAVVSSGKPLRRAPGLAALARETWFYDSASRNLYLRVHVPSGGTVVHNLHFQ